ncbi:hypothetical protein GQ53DRAFT_627118, partial [Thozetella sp. PMI_491]
FDWAAVKPATKLAYHPCYDGFLCARLQVPMDWHDRENGKTVAIAIITLPAVVDVDDPAYGGPIFSNPGGPGGSGVMFVRKHGRRLQHAVDGKKRYDIVSFDPRGVQFTTPRADCFNDVFARNAWQLESRGSGGLDGSPDSLRRELALYRAIGSLCDKTLGNSEILKHVSTPAVCRDMVEMVDRFDERRRERLKALSRSDDGGIQHPLATPESPVARLQYVGLSYGSVLGMTFASLFPGRVGRILVDGIGDAYDYVEGRWLTFLTDTEAIVDYFYRTCFEEGDRCPLQIDSDKCGKDIKARVDKLIADADESPISYVHDRNVRAITGNDIRYSMIPALYNSLLFEMLARLLAGALAGDFSLLLEILDLPILQDACTENSAVPGESDAEAAVLCSDGEDNSHQGPSYFANYIDQLKNQSDTLGAHWATIRTKCSGRQWDAKWRFKGPFTTPPAEPGKEGVPDAPLLFLSNRLDPVTPLVNAYAMSGGYPGSAVVIQESSGHCAIASGWSQCTNQIIRDYFERGVVPKNGTVCESECRP